NASKCSSATSSSPRRTALSAFCSSSSGVIGRIVPNAQSGREQWLPRGKEPVRPALQGELLQPVDGAGEAGCESQRAQTLRVVPAIRRELLEQARLQPRRSDGRLAVESQTPSPGDAPVQRTPQDPIGKVLREPETHPCRARRVGKPARFSRSCRLENCARELLQGQRRVVGDVEGAPIEILRLSADEQRRLR